MSAPTLMDNLVATVGGDGHASARMRTTVSCFEAVEREGTEQRIRIEDLAFETVTAVIAHRDGWRLCFASGVVIHVERGHTFDVAGNAVIEP